MRGLFCAIFTVILFSSSGLHAQQPGQGQSSSEPKAQDETGQKPSQTAEQATGAAQESSSRSGDIPAPVAPAIRVLGRAGSLPAPLRGALSLGPVYVSSFEYLYMYDRFDVNGTGSPTLGSRDLMSDILQLNVVADHQFRRSRVAFQYQPRVTFREGEVIKDFYNQHLNFDTYYMVSRNWTLGLGDQFAYLGNRDLAVDTFFSVDTSSFLQNNFLDSPSRLVSNEVHLNLDYQPTRRTRVSFLPSFTYVYNSPHGNFSSSHGRYYGFTASVDHEVTARTNVGLYYSSQYVQFVEEFQDTLFQGAGVSFSHQLSQGWRTYGSVGGSTATDFSRRPRSYSMTGSLGITRRYRRSSFGVAYDRGFEFPGFISSGYHDRADVEFSTQLTRRLVPSLGGGLFRDVNSPQRIRGTYGTMRLTYRLFGGLSWQMSYVYRNQVGDGVQVSNGIRQSVIAGFQWVPGSDRVRP